MRDLKLTVRCLVEQKRDHWQAFSLEFGLAAQGETRHEAMHKLEQMIATYVFDAVAGEDKEFGADLLSRRATMPVYVRYYSTLLTTHFAKFALLAPYFAKKGAYKKAMPDIPTPA